MLMMVLDKKLKVPQIISMWQAEYVLNFMAIHLVFVETFVSDRLIKRQQHCNPYSHTTI